MKPEEANVYREIQKNTEMAIKAIDALSDKAYELMDFEEKNIAILKKYL